MALRARPYGGAGAQFIIGIALINGSTENSSEILSSVIEKKAHSKPKQSCKGKLGVIQYRDHF